MGWVRGHSCPAVGWQSRAGQGSGAQRPQSARPAPALAAAMHAERLASGSMACKRRSSLAPGRGKARGPRRGWLHSGCRHEQPQARLNSGTPDASLQGCLTGRRCWGWAVLAGWKQWWQRRPGCGRCCPACCGSRRAAAAARGWGCGSCRYRGSRRYQRCRAAAPPRGSQCWPPWCAACSTASPAGTGRGVEGAGVVRGRGQAWTRLRVAVAQANPAGLFST